MVQKQNFLSWKNFNRSIGVVFLLFLFSCESSPDLEQERQAIIDIIGAVEKAHFDKDVEAFYAANDSVWTDVRNGRIELATKVDEMASTKAYFDRMKYDELLRLGEPILTFSDDASMATYIGSVMARGSFGESPIFWVFSWQSVFKKKSGEWKLISTANTMGDPATTADVLLDQVKKTVGELKEESCLQALAQCQGPDGSFQTLVTSSHTDGRMEQNSVRGSMVLKHGQSGSWFKDTNSGQTSEELDDRMRHFTVGHELHWLMLRPEDRLTDPKFNGVKTFQDKLAMEVEFSDPLQRPFKFYYSFENFQPIGFDMEIDDQGTAVSVIFGEWEDNDGIYLFRRAEFKDPLAGAFVYNYTDLQIDEGLMRNLDKKALLID